MVSPQSSPEYELPNIETPPFPDRAVSHYLLNSCSIRSEYSDIYCIPEEGVFIEEYGLLEDDDSFSRRESTNERDIESDATSLHDGSLKRAPSSKCIEDQNLVEFLPLHLVSLSLNGQGYMVRTR